jgi:hypothetical protein
MSRKPLPKRYTTQEIEDLAFSLGAYHVTVYGWRHRGVPLAWRIKLVSASKGKLKFEDFETPKRKRKWTR